MPLIIGGSMIVGGLLTSSAAGKASDAQAASDAARLAEEQRVREQLRQDTEVQRQVADQAFQDYQNGLISQAEAQQRATQAYSGIQQQIAKSQLSDVAKTQAMTQFQPYSIKTGTGSTSFDPTTGQAGFQLSPQLRAMQQKAYGAARDITGNLTTRLTPEQQAYQNRMYGAANQVASNLTTGLTPEQQAYQQRAYGTALGAMGSIAATPEAAAQQYMQQQMGLLQPSRQAEDVALRQQQLQRGRIGLGISGEAAGAGIGGMVNPEQFARDRARALADAQIAAGATQAGQQQAANQLQLAQGLFGQGAAGTAQQQQQLANQISASSGMFGQGAAGTAQQQQQLANQISAGQGLYNLGYAPDQAGLNMMNMGMNFGQTQQAAGINQANLYNQGMANVYGSTLGAAGSMLEGSKYVPQAYSTIGGEAYKRQQQNLQNLQGSGLPYQPMTTPQPLIPGSAYAGAALGGNLMNIGMRGMTNYMKPQQSSNFMNDPNSWWNTGRV